MAGLGQLNLAHNAITGALPPEWAALGNLYSVRLEHNKLVGPIPPGWNYFLGEGRSVSGDVPATALSTASALRRHFYKSTRRIRTRTIANESAGYRLTTEACGDADALDALPASRCLFEVRHGR